MQYSLNEICLLPSSIPSDIKSRKDVDPYIDGKLPVFVAPMTSVVNMSNCSTFEENKVIPILPRNVEHRIATCLSYWSAFSLKEFKQYFVGKVVPVLSDKTYKVLIDVANGHMAEIFDVVKKAKKYYGKCLKIMAGNIAHPSIYKYYCEAGIDYCRVGIGGGSVCSTSATTSIHASHLYMIEGIKKLNCYYDPNRTKLIADGGINTIDKAIKCLAIGYDYVMMGKCFAQCEEACGETAIDHLSGHKSRKYYGMASERGQEDISGGVCKNPEGIETWVEVNTNIKDFTYKFESALRSAMSYACAHNLKEFQVTEYDIQSVEEFKSYYK